MTLGASARYMCVRISPTDHRAFIATDLQIEQIGQIDVIDDVDDIDDSPGGLHAGRRARRRSRHRLARVETKCIHCTIDFNRRPIEWHVKEERRFHGTPGLFDRLGAALSLYFLFIEEQPCILVLKKEPGVG